MESNFEFLEKYWPELASIGKMAEAYLFKDANTCISKIGYLSEKLVKGIYFYEKIDLPDDQRQSNLIRGLNYRNLLPENIDNILYAIRKARNNAIHQGEGNLENAKILLKMAYILCSWYMEVYGDWNYEAKEYIEPLEDDVSEDIIDVIKDHEDSLNELYEEIERIKTAVSEKNQEERVQKSENVAEDIYIDSDVKEYIDAQKIKIDVELVPCINYALIKNGFEIINKFVIENSTENIFHDAVIRLTSNSGFIYPYEKEVALIPANNSISIRDFKIEINGAFFLNLQVKDEAFINVSLIVDGQDVCNDRLSISVLPFDYWQGFKFAPQLLSAFVTPNAPEITSIVKRASQFLGKWTESPSLDAYQSQDVNRVYKQIAGVYSAIQELNITYSEHKASFGESGQRVRLCDEIVETKFGTCMDLALLFASCLEHIGINSILILLEGHIFCGAWLQDNTFPDSVFDDGALLSKKVADGIAEIAVFECTSICCGSNISFDASCDLAKSELKNGEAIVCVIDVEKTRMLGVVPLPSRIKDGVTYKFVEDEKATFVSGVPDREVHAIEIDPNNINLKKTKKELWERKLLDLGLRNKLISMSLNPLIPLLINSVDDLEDALSDGMELHVFPKPEEYNVPSSQLDFEMMNDIGPFEKILQAELKSKRLRAAIGEGELQVKLKSFYRSAKLSIEENGANTLYIVLGILKWFETDRSKKPRYAPLLLIPIEMVRKGGNQGYVVRMRDDDIQMNITILEKLSQDYQIIIPGMDELPKNEHGLDTRTIFATVRKGIMNQPRWDVLESAYIGIFSFSQFVMWNDIRNRSDELEKNKIVKSLMTGRLAWEPEPLDLESYVPSDEVYLPISVDGSQLYAVDSAAKGASFVLHGPPGTGKSQTITVMIANALAQGKTVLFVAEKMAALSVVQNRLEQIGLKPFCLELHSNKAKKKDVLQQLRIASEVCKGNNKEQYERKLKNLSNLKIELDKYVLELHKKRTSGFSFFEIINLYEEYKEANEISYEGFADYSEITPANYEDMNLLVERLIATAKSVGHPCNNALLCIGVTEYSQTLKLEMSKCIQDYLDKLKTLQSFLFAFTLENKINRPEKFEDIKQLIGNCSQFEILYKYPLNWILQDNMTAFVDTITMANLFISAQKYKQTLSSRWNENFLLLPVDNILLEYNTAMTKWVLVKKSAINRISKSLALYSRSGINKECLGQDLLDLKNYQNSINKAEALLAQYKEFLGFMYMGNDTDWEQIITSVQEAKDTLTELRASGIDRHFIKMIFENENNQKLISNMTDAYVDMRRSRSVLGNLLLITWNDAADKWFESQYNLFDNILNNIDNIKEWITWLTVSKEANENGLSNIVNAYYEGMEHDIILNSYYKSLYKYLALGVLKESPVLNAFSGALFDEKVNQFKKLDKDITELSKKAIYYKLASNVPVFTREASKSSEVGILQKALKSNGRGLSIRNLMDQLSELIPRLCPCMLMSPISAAQYLDTNREPFDLVIFDEASQLPTSKAVGVLARGKEAVIVGDPNQMPPTTFFAANTYDEDNAENEDLESILDDCLALNMPQTHLLWHYRSRHESLISFSNSQFYENRLYTFPSVNDRESKVSLVHVDGMFERSKGRKNRIEAIRVVDEIVRRFEDENLRQYSVGVVTFNIAQQNLIDDLLSERYIDNPQLEAWVYNDKEPLFIKNLENVQGDERDVILFSVGYGPDEQGKISMNFGPLNREGGWRRLNVAVSRARQEMKVFSSLRPDQINLAKTSAQGVVALRAFLEYAAGRTNIMDENLIMSGINSEEGIAKSIQEYLDENGYKSDLLVGKSGFKIDIGIIDPQDNDRYLLGIILDGNSYNNAKTTKDREVANIEVLKGLGWNVHRIWTMDWYDNKNKELSDILSLIHKLQNNKEKLKYEGTLSNISLEKEITYDNYVDDLKFDSNKSSQAITYVEYRAKPYVGLTLQRKLIDAESFLEWYRPETSSRIYDVINKEGPICEQFLYKKIVNSFGITKIGSRIKRQLDLCVMSHPDCQVTIQNSGKVIWPKGINEHTYRGFRDSGDKDNKRDAKNIPVQEALNAIYYILYNDINVEENDLIKNASKMMGFEKCTNIVTDFYKEALNLGEKNNTIIFDAGKVALTDSGKEIARQVFDNFDGIEKTSK